MSECPYCHRRLLSQASPKCNWCGREIPDAAYQQHAAVEREVAFAQQAIHDAVSLARIESINTFDPLMMPLDPLTGLPLGGAFLPARRMPLAPMLNNLSGPAPAFGHAYDAPEQPAEAAPPEEEATPKSANGGRFGHLEL